ncbi:MAG TPA: hypothetical protein VK203_07855 [Nostocaceae cyanobacterium]|nr:hypothetical protein [Nostocaceae cyanobacterium]
MSTEPITQVVAEVVPTTPQEIKTKLAQLAVYSDKYTLRQLADELIQLAADITCLIPSGENTTLDCTYRLY